MWCCAHVASAQTSPPAGASSAAAAPTSAAEVELSNTKLALERARFDEATQLAQRLVAAPGLPARLRNEAWELLAIAQIAQRKEREARESLRTLYRRDPKYARQVADPGPAVDAAFARARLSGTEPLEVPMRYVAEPDADLRLHLSVDLTGERDAVESVHVLVDEGRGEEFAHLVAEVKDERPLAFVLPQPAAHTEHVQLVIEARAPSGALLGRLGEPTAPLLLAVPHAPPPPPPCPPSLKPLRREWWLWTTVGLVVSGFVVAAAVAAN